MSLADTVFQGVVLGPPLWNTFFSDVADEVRALDFQEVVFADDLNAFKVYGSHVANDTIVADLATCQFACHAWGRANQVEFESSKEHFVVLDRSNPCGDPFKLLGVIFDTKLTMKNMLVTLAHKINWKVRSLFRLRPFYSVKHLIRLYKAHVVSQFEWCTPAIYHATKTELARIDVFQTRFLRFLNVSWQAAFLDFNVVPLALRRHIAMLGFIHKWVLRLVPPALQNLFAFSSRVNAYSTRQAESLHRLQLVDPFRSEGYHERTALLSRSVDGLIGVYNRLPAHVVAHKTVKAFPQDLNNGAKSAVVDGVDLQDLCELLFI